MHIILPNTTWIFQKFDIHALNSYSLQLDLYKFKRKPKICRKNQTKMKAILPDSVHDGLKPESYAYYMYNVYSLNKIFYLKKKTEIH